MTVEFDRATPSDPVQEALDASCVALLALEQARDAMSSAGTELGPSIDAELQAMELVRAAIRDLRRITRLGAPSPLALGFAQAACDEPPEARTGEA